MGNHKILVVGAGFAGSAIARSLAEAGFDIDVIERRTSLGGNAHDYLNRHGERIHLYGPHLLHGDRESVAIRWLSRFTDWTHYEHRVRALLPDGRTTPLPVNRTTLEDVFNISLTSEEHARELLSQEVLHKTVNSADDVFLNCVGPRLADLLFRPYTKKMWGVEASELEAAVGSRLPVRVNRDDRYFTDSFQALPRDGYTVMFERILNHKRITLILNQPYTAELDRGYLHTFLSVPMDEYFDFAHGRLPYRSIRFEHGETSISQPTAVVNFTDQGPYTRMTQWDLFPNSGKRNDGLHSCTREIPCAAEANNNECYYPVRNAGSLQVFARYQELADKEERRTFIGRAGLFSYIDMVPCVAMHLQIATRFLAKHGYARAEGWSSQNAHL